MFALGAILLLAMPAVAQDETEAEPEPLWANTLGLSYLSTSGNTDTQTFGLDFSVERKPSPWGLSIVGSFNRADQDGEVTAERYFVSAQAKRALSERWEVFGGVSGEKDEFAGFDLRMVVDAGVTYHALLGPTHFLSFDAGLAWTDEDRIEPEEDVSYLGGILGLSYEWKFSESASLTERLVFYPNFDDTSDWRFNSVTAVTASLTKVLALQASYEIRYRNQPIGDNDDTDTATKISVVANF
jgi:putative salt-induced outer membrane protein